mgnify:CR=1 FL=1
MEGIKKVSQYIENWLIKYIKKSKMNGFVVGVSGGIDSAVTSSICARTGYPTLCLEMGINQNIGTKFSSKFFCFLLVNTSIRLSIQIKSYMSCIFYIYMASFIKF